MQSDMHIELFDIEICAIKELFNIIIIIIIIIIIKDDIRSHRRVLKSQFVDIVVIVTLPSTMNKTKPANGLASLPIVEQNHSDGGSAF